MTQRIMMIGLNLGGKVKRKPTLDYTGQLAKAASVGIIDSRLGLHVCNLVYLSVLIQVYT